MGWEVLLLARVLSEEVIFELRPEGREGRSHGEICGNDLLNGRK